MYATETAREVEKNYIDTGLVKFVYWDLPLGSHGYPAVVSAEASHCAGEQDAYWEMHDALFGEWKMLSELDPEDEAAAVEAVLPIGEPLVEDGQAFQACVETQKYRPVVATMLRQAMDMEINATPAFLFGTVSPSGEQHVEPVMGYVEYEEFAKMLDREISRAQGTPIPDPTEVPTPDADAADDGGAAADDSGDGEG
ncbi:MAG: thioredoxin domain-containing protein [Caldilineae bacterium]|nr:thioredoxin domain-containing protein [Chloroflexota bacterium]MCB9177339.1 thioredoxin domain-containing protein [Caldilineae bacterium]